jgi:hypothetical protein
LITAALLAVFVLALVFWVTRRRPVPLPK